MFEVEIMQIFETLDNMERNLDAPPEIFAVMRSDLNNALFSECSCYGNLTPNEVLTIYMDDMGEFSLIAPNTEKKIFYEDLANMTKRLKQFYIEDLFDKNINHPVEDYEYYKKICDDFEKKFMEDC